MTRRLRAGGRLVALGVVCGAIYTWLVVAGWSYDTVLRFRRSSRSSAAWRGRVFRRWAGLVAWLIGMRIAVRGVPPQPPFFLVSNHLGYVDVLLLASQVPCVFVARADVAGWPIVGSLCRSVGTLFIDRESKRDVPRTMKGMVASWGRGSGVVVFPEGTSTRGDRVGRFRPSLLEAAVRAGVPASYATIWYETPAGETPAHLAVCWWGGMPFAGHLWKLLELPRFRARLTFGEEPIRESDRKVLATRLHRAVETQFEAVV